MTDLPLTTDLTNLPIGTLLRRRDGQTRKMVATSSNHSDFPIVLDDGICVAANGKASNWPINDIIGIADWPPLDRPRYYFASYVKLDVEGNHKFIGQLFYEAIHGSPATDDLFIERIKQLINKKFPEQSDLNCIITNLNELQP
jgi:hypothetical protein